MCVYQWKECTTLVRDIGNGEGCAYMGGAHLPHTPAPQFCRGPNAALKNNVYLLKTLCYSKESSCALTKNWKLAEEKQHLSSVDMVKKNGLSFKLRGKKWEYKNQRWRKAIIFPFKSIVCVCALRVSLYKVWSVARRQHHLAACWKCGVSGPTALNQALHLI